MRQFIESLKRLYNSNQIEESKIIDMHKRGIINEEEKNYILEKEE